MEDIMSKKKALTLGVFTLLPFLYIIFFIVFFLGIFTTMANSQNNSFNSIFFIIFPIHFGIIIEIIVLLIIYIKNVFNNENIEETKRTLWALVLFFGNIIAMPVYWYINIWKPIKKEKHEEI
jgi:heme/copper-type cytochrome/quinol oxidase subunit 3